MLTESPNMLCCKDRGPRVKLSLWPFFGWISGPTKAIWASLEKEKAQWIRYLAGGTGWFDTYKKKL